MNATIVAIYALLNEGSAFIPIWFGTTLVVCAYLAHKSRIAKRRSVTRVSRRGARKLAQTAILLALPWAVLPVYTFGLYGSIEPLVVIQITAGMVAGGAFILHRAFVAAICFKATILVGLNIAVHLGAWDAAWITTLYSLIFLGFLSFFSFQAGQTAREKDRSMSALARAVTSLEAARDENFHLANVDDVTGLMNRKAFKACLKDHVDRVRRDTSGFTLFLMDLDRFKNVNDLFGHGVGDDLLAVFADRLRKVLRRNDVVARLGGDEFAVILPGVTEAKAIDQLSETLLSELERPGRLGQHFVHSGASIGAVVCPRDACEPADLLLKADLALNRAKDNGRGRCVSFDAPLRERVVANNEVEAGLRNALAKNLVFIEYQPKIALHDSRIIGAEALVRMKNTDGSTLPPDRFLPIAAERGLLTNLSRMIADRVAKDILQWKGRNLDVGKIALNIHPDDIKSPEFLMETIDILEGRGVTSADLTLEITEGCFIGRGTDRATMVLDALSERGYQLSLDDFGTGHASLSHLKRIPVDELKIDRSFICAIEESPADRAIVAAICEITRGMNIRSVAEGVETATQLAILRDFGIDVGQGFFWSRPVSADKLARFVAEHMRKAG